MPTYCYRDERTGEIHERDFLMGFAPRSIAIGLGYDQIATRDYRAEHVGGIVKGTDNPARSRPKKAWPMEPCCASGVHASQAPELRKHFKKHGLNVQVTNDGDPIYESAAQRKRALKSRGMYDKASFN